MTSDRESWFEPKRFGYGAGLPVHPKGWAVLGVYVAGMIVSSLFFTLALPAAFGLLVPRGPGQGYGYGMPGWALALFMGLWLVLAVLPLTLWVTVVARRRTRGGWRWRWGGGDDGPVRGRGDEL